MRAPRSDRTGDNDREQYGWSTDDCDVVVKFSWYSVATLHFFLRFYGAEASRGIVLHGGACMANRVGYSWRRHRRVDEESGSAAETGGAWGASD